MTTVPDPSTATDAPRTNCPKWMSRWVWQLVILIAGTVTILAGIIMLFIPGPGTLVIYAGLGMLATEFIWAKQLFLRLRDWLIQLWKRFRAWMKYTK